MTLGYAIKRALDSGLPAVVDVLIEFVPATRGALLRIEIELRCDFLIALGQVPPRRRRVQPEPERGGDKAQIQHQRDDQHVVPLPAPRDDGTRAPRSRR